MIKRRTTKEFIEKSIQKHGNKYDYTMVEYKNDKTKVIILCKIHGAFKQTPNNHLSSSGCKKCSDTKKGNTISLKNRDTLDIFLLKSLKVHGAKYDYSLVDYVNSRTKINIICPVHGVFEQTPNSHTSGYGCKKCGRVISGEKTRLKLKLTTDQFIHNANIIHEYKYNYSLTNYIDNRTKVKIICPVHGVFEQTPNSHISGHGCSICSGKEKFTLETYIKKCECVHKNKYDYSNIKEYFGLDSKYDIICPTHGVFNQNGNSHIRGNGCPRCVGRGLSLEQLIVKFNAVHNNKYDYTLVKFKKNSDMIKIICPTHGIFNQKIKNHLSGRGCQTCSNNQKSNKEDFIEKSNIIHGNKYDYSIVEYKNCMTKVDIICNVHGVFKQRPNDHLSNYGCPKCNESKGEKAIRIILDNYNIKTITQKKFMGCLDKAPLKFDFYLPDYNVCIEFDGKQHFEQKNSWGGAKALADRIYKDQIKNDFCKNNNIPLYRIRYDENITERMSEILKIINKL